MRRSGDEEGREPRGWGQHTGHSLSVTERRLSLTDALAHQDVTFASVPIMAIASRPQEQRDDYGNRRGELRP